jgi:serine/threonine protein phosphatase PrpC
MNHSFESKIKFYSTDDSTDNLVKPIEFTCGGHIISKDEEKSSEDAVFTHPNALGVADGVGGWIKYGISSSKFSNELMNNCYNEVNKKIITEQSNSSVSESSQD